MRALIACEFSGTVRDAFIRRGHDAWSCDLLPTEKPGPHIQGDVLTVLGDRWDLMVAHPPCTHLAVSGARYFAEKRKDGRQHAALEFVRALLAAPIPRIALENPVSVISSAIRRPDQLIQPWQFGHAEAKTTCLWLKNLPPLTPTKVLPTPASGRWGNQTPSGQNKLSPSPDRWKLRSATYAGIAEAMASQWGGLPVTPTDRASAEAFVRWCAALCGDGYHPDTRWAECIDNAGLPSFPEWQSADLERLTGLAFDLLGDDIYAVALAAMRQPNPEE